MTFYPGSGLDPFDPDALDLWLGQLWAEARRGGEPTDTAVWFDAAARKLTI